MKRTVFVVSLALAALGFLMSPPLAAAGPPRGAPTLSAFLSSLAKPASMPAAKKPPTGQEKSQCSATANCRFGGTIYCEGNNSCSAVDGDCSWGNVGYVVCDGHYYSCGGSCCGDDFCTRGDQCAWSCNPCSSNYTCNYQYCFDDCECNYSTCPI